MFIGLIRWLIIGGLIGLMAGCVSLPEPVDKHPSYALTQPQQTTLGKIAQRSVSNPALSGFRLIPTGAEKRGMTLALMQKAEKTIDMQYFVFNDDNSGKALLEQAQIAAHRGVRVRLLIDDYHTAGKDGLFAQVAQQANIEIRLFNPFAAARDSLLTRVFTSIQRFEELNHRMHNKLFIADNAIVLTGGRNVGDENFDSNPDNFVIDLDLLVTGKVVKDLSKTFDDYWNSSLAYPVATFKNNHMNLRDANEANQKPLVEDRECECLIASHKLLSELESGQLELLNAPAYVVVDQPEKAIDGKVPDTAYDDAITLARKARQEIFFLNPYFIPKAGMLELLGDALRQGKKVQLLTNSLDAMDAPLAFTLYAKERVGLLAQGMTIYELSPFKPIKNQDNVMEAHSHPGMHAKAIIVDRQVVFIGSVNLDPRSHSENTEVGLVIRSPELAKQTQVFIDRLIEHSYRLSLVDPPANSDKVGKVIQWQGGADLHHEIRDHEPGKKGWALPLLQLITPLLPEKLF